MVLDKNRSKKLVNRLNEFTEYGMTLYYLLEEGRTDISELKTLFFSSDDDKSTFTYGMIIRNIGLNDIKNSNDKYKEEHPNEDLKSLNVIYIKKLLDEVVVNFEGLIDVNYIDTYNYLLAKY